MGRDDLDDLVLVPLTSKMGGGREMQHLRLLARERVVGDLLHEVLEEPVLASLGREGIGAERNDLLPHE